MMGYGLFHYRYSSGREGDAFKIHVRCTKRGISLHCLAADSKGYVAEQFKFQLPKAKVGKGCVRFGRLADLDQDVLRELIRKSASAGWG